MRSTMSLLVVTDGVGCSSVSRYIHLSPCSGGQPLAESPELYPYSSYADYARKTRRVDWIDYDQHHRYRAAKQVWGINYA